MKGTFKRSYDLNLRKVHGIREMTEKAEKGKYFLPFDKVSLAAAKVSLISWSLQSGENLNFYQRDEFFCGKLRRLLNYPLRRSGLNVVERLCHQICLSAPCGRNTLMTEIIWKSSFNGKKCNEKCFCFTSIALPRLFLHLV